MVSGAETQAPKEPGAPGGAVSSAEARPRPRGQDVPGVGRPSGRPWRLPGLASGLSFLPANLNYPDFFISKAGIKPPLPSEGCGEDRGAALRHSTCCATASVHTHGIAAALGRQAARARRALGAAAERVVLTLRLSHKPNTLVKHLTCLSPAPQEEAA